MIGIENKRIKIQGYKNSIIGMPDYLLKIGDGGSQKMIARWRCGNEEEMDSGRQRIRKDVIYEERKKTV